MLAVWRAGCAYLGIDGGCPPSRRDRMLAAAGATAVVVDTDRPAGVAVVPVASVAAQSAPTDEPLDGRAGAPGTPGGLALVALAVRDGRPAPFGLTHRAVTRLAAAGADWLGAGPGVTVLHYEPVTAVTANAQLWATLGAGATVVMTRRDRLATGELAGEIRRWAPARVRLANDRLRALRAVDPDALAVAEITIDEICVDGAALQRGPAPVVGTRPRRMAYGPPELGGAATAGVVTGPAGPAWPLLGRPLPGATVRLLDADGRPVPTGARGRLHLGGMAPGDGFLDTTPDPVGGPMPTPYFGRWRADGQLELLDADPRPGGGAGAAVDLAEIEQALAACAGVVESTVVGAPDGLPVAFLRPKPGTDLDEVRRDLVELLPAGLVPARLVAVDALPRTTDGAVDRAALVKEAAPRAPHDDAVTPAGLAALADVWRDVLGVTDVGPDDNFFTLGGYSLLGVELAVRVRQRLGAEIDVRAVFDHPTPRRMARALADSGVRRPPLERTAGDRSGPAPLSFAQRRLWFFERLEPGTGAYHVPLVMRVDAPVDEAALARAIDALVVRHEALRTTFPADRAGEPHQHVHPPGPVPLIHRDGRAADGDTTVDTAVRELMREPFDLSAGPLLRAALVALSGYRAALVLVLHHIVADGWSLGVLVRDLAELYRAERSGAAPVLPDLPVHARDLAIWQHGPAGDALAAGQVAYWLAELAGAEELDLPTDRPRGADTGYLGDEVRVELPERVATALVALAQREGCTPFAAIVAVHQAVLSVYTGQTQVLAGLVSAGRDRPELTDAVGFFVNTVVLRGDLSGEPSFRELLRRVAGRVSAALRHQDVPFERLVAELAPRREIGRNPLIQVVAQHQQSPAVGTRAGDLEVCDPPAATGASRFDLELHSAAEGDRIECSFVYRTALFDRATVEALAACWRDVVTAAVAEPDTPMCLLPLVAGDTAERLLRFNPPPVPLPPGTVDQLVAARAAETPHAPAVRGDGETATYRELDAAGDRLARWLRRRGVGPGSIVGICHRRGVSCVALLLGVLRAGGAYLPLDPHLPQRRMRFMLTDAAADLVVASADLATAVPSGVPLAVLDGDGDGDGDAEPDGTPAGASAADLAYVIYTSGSTGRPKGVQITHEGVVRLVLAAAQWCDLGPGSSVLQLAPLIFDASTLEIWGPLVAGGMTVAVDTGRYAEKLPDVLRRHPVSTLLVVPAQLEALLHADHRALAGVRQVLVGGDVVGPGLIRDLRALAPHCTPVALYGPTETTMLATAHPGAAPVGGRTPLGRPIANTSVHLLDRWQRQVPIGARAEICIGGPGVARGYLGRPDLTARRFVADPFGPPGARLFRSGDLGRLRADGMIEFHGRADDQVKLRGHRIELAEVEQAMAGHPQVRRAAAVVRDLPAGPALIGYVQPDGADVDPAGVRSHVGELLPAPMVPAHIVVVPQLPLSASNKIDRAALPDPVLDADPPAELRSGLDALVAEAWSSLLRRPIGRHDDFFAAGGHSILAVAATAAARELIGAEVPLGLIFERPVLGAYTDGLRSAGRHLVAGGDPPGGPAGASAGTMTRFDAPGDERCAGRRVDLYRPFGWTPGADQRLLVVLDGSDFADVVRLPAILDTLIARGTVAPVPALLVGHRDWAARNAELFDGSFARWVRDDLATAARTALGLTTPTPPGGLVFVGASAGAVAGYVAAAQRPDLVAGVVALSGAFWWQPPDGPDGGWAATAGRFGPAHRFYFYAGDREREPAGPNGLTVLDATRTLADAVARSGAEVIRRKGRGGHTFAAWQRHLPEGLATVL
jgi:amino acid adenylation domain-containing protein